MFLIISQAVKSNKDHAKKQGIIELENYLEVNSKSK